MTTDLERFYACTEYRACDRRPNHELGIWPQARQEWREQAPEAVSDFTWNWFVDEPGLNLDRREYVPVNYGFIPPYEPEVIEDAPQYEIVRNSKGIVTKALKAGTVGGGRMCMDQYLEFPVSGPEDWPDVRRRLEAAIPDRYPDDLDDRIEGWKTREFPLILGRNAAANGFYWRARELMGTEALSLAWYDHPKLLHEIMEFYADFVIETSRPVLDRIDVEYFTLNEDLSMKSGPLLSPKTYREFIFPHLCRMVDFMKSHGVSYFALDTDGDPTVLVPMFMEAGVDVLWPIERASGVSPQGLREEFGKDLRLWGGVDKRVLFNGPEPIRAHLAEFIPLIEQGGYIPTVDHTVPPGVTWDNFRYYMDYKMHLLSGEFGRLGA